MATKIIDPINQFLKTGKVPAELLHAYDQTGAKIPRHLVMDWLLENEGSNDPIQKVYEKLPEQIEKKQLASEETPWEITTSYLEESIGIITAKKIAGYLIHIGTGHVDVPLLKEIGMGVIIPYAEQVSLPKIQAVNGHLLLESATQVNIGSLKQVNGRMDVGMVYGLYAPELVVTQEILADTSESIHLPKLEKVGMLSGTLAKTANLGKIKPEQEGVELGESCQITQGE